ncbi:MAG: hypothetical protein MZV70_16575 [Desulfobacterales bacterium]|nr:hypothetical protein [Desulfobacterales bacterium]
MFAAAGQQKIIVATNIAETSLTIPGIKYVIDAGLARILEYNPRSQTTGLPIKPISTEQRRTKKRTLRPGAKRHLHQALFPGRVFSKASLHTAGNNAFQSGRRYSADAFPQSRFGQLLPFVDRPQPKSIRDGIDILHDLGALTKDDRSEEANLL